MAAVNRVPSGRNELSLIPWVVFDIVEWILRVLEGWELGNKGLYMKYWSYKEIIKNSI